MKIQNIKLKNRAGFSIIELLIVVVIIGIISAIAIPNILASRRSANESSAIALLRVITGAQATYLSSVGAGIYGDSAALQTAGLIDNSVTNTNGKNGYLITVSALAPTSAALAFYDAFAVPIRHGRGFGGTGSRSFATNESGVIYVNDTAVAPTFNATTRIVTSGSPLNP